MDFTRDSGDEFTMICESYPVDKRDFLDKIFIINIESCLLCLITLQQQMTQVETIVLPIVWTLPDIQ